LLIKKGNQMKMSLLKPLTYVCVIGTWLLRTVLTEYTTLDRLSVIMEFIDDVLASRPYLSGVSITYVLQLREKHVDIQLFKTSDALTDNNCIGTVVLDIFDYTDVNSYLELSLTNIITSVNNAQISGEGLNIEQLQKSMRYFDANLLARGNKKLNSELTAYVALSKLIAGYTFDYVVTLQKITIYVYRYGVKGKSIVIDTPKE